MSPNTSTSPDKLPRGKSRFCEAAVLNARPKLLRRTVVVLNARPKLLRLTTSKPLNPLVSQFNGKYRL